MMISIDYLCDKPEFIKEIVEDIWSEWSRDFIYFTNYKSLQDLLVFYKNTTKDIPTCFVLHDDLKVLGSCLIDIEDMQVHQELRPWLANVYIHPEYRNKKYATQLIQYVVERFPVLNLWTFTEDFAKFYERFGFKTKEIIPHHGYYNNLYFMQRSNC